MSDITITSALDLQKRSVAAQEALVATIGGILAQLTTLAEKSSQAADSLSRIAARVAPDERGFADEYDDKLESR